MALDIGVWIRRSRGKWHLVESVVAEDAVTRCGRRMDRVTRTGGELQVSEWMPLTRAIGQPQLCRQCHGGPHEPGAVTAAGDMAFPDDDGAGWTPEEGA